MKNLRQLVVFALLSSCAALLSACQEPSSIGVIGGADGPTSIFIKSAPARGWLWLVLLLVLIVLAARWAVRRKRR